VIAAWAITPKTAKYAATATIYVGARQFSVSPDARYSFDPTALVERLMLTYSKMLDSKPIAEDALRASGAQRSSSEVVANTDVQPSKDTQLLTVTVTDPDPAVARTLTNAIAQAFVEKVATLDAGAAPAQEGTLPGLPAYIFEKAKLPTTPVSNGLLRNSILAGLFGLLVSVGIVFLLEYLDLTVKSPSEAEARLHLPVLGVIPYDPDQESVRMGPRRGRPQIGTPSRQVV
jgi:capsular polysaccharide biosynthesis protein